VAKTSRSTSHPAAFKGTTTTKRLAGARKPKAAPARSAAPDAVALLRADHKLVTELFGKFDKMKGDGPQKKALVERICNELTVHTRIEEEIFYPAARAALKDGDMMDEAQVEHDGAKQLIAQLRGMQPGDDMYDAKVTVLSEYIKHHVKEEQTDMFPKANKTRLDMKALGQQLAARKQELMAQIDRIR
jgi:hemerythrin superfamily protein